MDHGWMCRTPKYGSNPRLLNRCAHGRRARRAPFCQDGVQDKDELPPLSRQPPREVYLIDRYLEPQQSCQLQERERQTMASACGSREAGSEREVTEREVSTQQQQHHSYTPSRAIAGIDAVSPLCAHSLLSPGHATGRSHHHRQTKHQYTKKQTAREIGRPGALPERKKKGPGRPLRSICFGDLIGGGVAMAGFLPRYIEGRGVWSSCLCPSISAFLIFISHHTYCRPAALGFPEVLLYLEDRYRVMTLSTLTEWGMRFFPKENIFRMNPSKDNRRADWLISLNPHFNARANPGSRSCRS